MPILQRRSTLPKTRVQFRAGVGQPDVASVWVILTENDTDTEIKLLYDYPDLKPLVGWQVQADDDVYNVTAVTGLKLTCEAV